MLKSSVIDVLPVKNGSDKEICHHYDAATHHYRELKEENADSFETLLTVILQRKQYEKHG